MRLVFLTMEMTLELPEPYCGANFRGGLGILSGDIMAGLPRINPAGMLRGLPDIGIEALGFVPLYHRPWFQKSTTLDYREIIGPPLFQIPMQIADRSDTILVFPLRRDHRFLYGLFSPIFFDILYTEDRWQRLLGEIAFPAGVAETCRHLNFRPDILWWQESHTTLAATHPYFEKTKKLFTIHTPEMAGMERFYGQRFETLGIPEHYRSIFAKNDMLDFTAAAMELADVVTAVSAEHAQTTKEMFPQHAKKIVGIRNGTDRRFWLDPYLPEKSVSKEKLLAAHKGARREALKVIERRSGIKLDTGKPTAWFVRRLAMYKNLHPMLTPILHAITAERGTMVNGLDGLGMQIVGAGMTAETDNECLRWIADWIRIARDELAGRFVLLNAYDVELLKQGAWGSDVWLVTPEPKKEACSTSDQRATINGVPVATSKTGGMREYIEEFDSATGLGNGFFIEPYEPKALYEKLRIFSNLWYEWHEHRRGPYPDLKYNAFRSGSKLDIQTMLEKYSEIFEKMLSTISK